MSETKNLASKIASQEEVHGTQVPDKGLRVFLTEEYHWVVNKMDKETYKMVKKYIRAGKETEAAQFAINSMMVKGTIDPNKIEDPDVLMGLENAVADMLNPVTAQIKKN